ncbi:YdhK family protein [Salinicoccus hispanicus]|uniref:DUF1541 domain-containing protein n=1 Tax=Salinicoccus hispanicus TaxID=157225 RepID=A0A6N8U068_9STAP|nr:YdhK family protein [Salinicoccus hispanicus]MXQ51638.1 DUF1541 domain-containing protein [Salinicoccus hispanicus]
MKNAKYLFGTTAMTVLILGACGADETQMQEGSVSEHETHEESMDHSSSGEVPDDLTQAEDPTYPVDSQAVIRTDHMAGMEGATATVTGAFDTTAYTVSYTPETGGDPVEDRKWVIHEEIEHPGEAPLAQGNEAVINANHMEGMKGATAKIDEAEQTTVYMVSYTDTETGDEVKHHKWVTEDELNPVE